MPALRCWAASASRAPQVCTPRHAAFTSAARGDPSSPDGRSLAEKGLVGFPAGPVGDAEQLRARAATRSRLRPPASPPWLGTVWAGGTVPPQAWQHMSQRAPLLCHCRGQLANPGTTWHPHSLPKAARPERRVRAGCATSAKRDCSRHQHASLSDRSSALSPPTSVSSGRCLYSPPPLQFPPQSLRIQMPRFHSFL